jgi:hypothetical protein
MTMNRREKSFGLLYLHISLGANNILTYLFGPEYLDISLGGKNNLPNLWG